MPEDGHGPVSAWEPAVEQTFAKLLAKVPAPMRGFARKKITAKAGQLAQAAGRGAINEKDMVDAFFAETPFGFHGPMKSDMAEMGVDYQQYGHPA